MFKIVVVFLQQSYHPPFKLKHPKRVYPEFVGLRVHAWVRPFCAQGTLLWTFLMVMILVYGFAIVGIVP